VIKLLCKSGIRSRTNGGLGGGGGNAIFKERKKRIGVIDLGEKSDHAREQRKKKEGRHFRADIKQ